MTSRTVNQNAKALAELLSADEIEKLLQEARERKMSEAEEAKDRERQAAAERIADLLIAATDALQEAGELAERYNIPFTFVTPKGKTEEHSGWKDSWFYSATATTGVNRIKVDSQPVGAYDDSHWQSSSYNC